MAAVSEIAEKVRRLYEDIQPAASDPMMDFDERDLVRLAEKAGFSELNAQLDIDVRRASRALTWDNFLSSSGNPRIPSPGEAIIKALSADECEVLKKHLRPLVDGNARIERFACVYLAATK